MSLAFRPRVPGFDEGPLTILTVQGAERESGGVKLIREGAEWGHGGPSLSPASRIRGELGTVEKQAPFGYAQGRLSTPFRFAALSVRSLRMTAVF